MTTTNALSLPDGYRAHLDPMTGVGLLVCPLMQHEDDVPDPFGGSESAQSLSYRDACRALERHGWHVSIDTDPEVPMALWGGVLAGQRHDGAEAVQLWHGEPIDSGDNPCYLAGALRALAGDAEVTLTS